LFRAVPKAKGEIIVLSDANAMYRSDAVKKLVRNFADRRIGCVSGRLCYKAKEGSMGKGESSYWEFDMILKKMASKLLVLGGGVNGSIMALRKNLYNPIDKNRGDDFEIANRVELAGYGVILDLEAISVEEASESSRQEFSRKVRLATWNLKSTLMLLKEAIFKSRFKTIFILFSHRFLRYTTPVWVTMALAGNLFYHSGAWGVLLALQVIFYSLAALGFIMEQKGVKLGRLFLLPMYFCMVNYAALIALFKNIIGDKQFLWEKVR
jgi:poly-beta-1,6-N-acetyl-D-glucosamine synthase